MTISRWDKCSFSKSQSKARFSAGTPSAPAGVRLVQEHNEWIVRWEKPLNDGGSSVTSYALEFRLSNIISPHFKLKPLKWVSETEEMYQQEISISLSSYET